MRGIELTGYSLARRYLGVQEIAGSLHNEQILAMLRLDARWPQADEVPWCSAFVNWIAWHLGVERSFSLRARSWLKVGLPIPLEQAEAGFDLAIFMTQFNDPGPGTIEATGHVGWFGSWDHRNGKIWCLGGNQGNAVSLAPYDAKLLLGIRRLNA